MALNIVLLVGGVGGAKLAYGLREILPADNLTIVVNTGDDFWHYGLRVCPDLDTITYTLSDLVDKRNGWGVANDTTQMLQGLQRYGEDAWFRLGDIDLATHLLRTQRLHHGETLTAITAHLRSQLGIQHTILPMTDAEVATVVETAEYGDLEFQTYFVRHRWQPTVTGLRYTNADKAQPTQAIYDALERADAILIGPSNPWLSIAPILNVRGLREALIARDVPRVAVTPIVSGKALKGPTAKIMAELGLPTTVEAVGEFYGQVINGFVYDQCDPVLSMDGLRTVGLQTIMRTDRDKIGLAEAIVRWLENWGRS